MKEIQISNAALRAELEFMAEAACSDVVVVGSGIAGLTAATHLANVGLKATVLEARPYLGGRCWERRVLAVEDVSVLEALGVPVRRDQTAGAITVRAVDMAIALLSAAREAGVCLLSGANVCDLVVHDEAVCGLMVSAVPGGVESAPGPCFAARAVVDATGHEARLVGVLRTKLQDFYPGGVGEGFVDAESSSARLVERTGEIYPGLYVAGTSAAAIYHLPRAALLVDGLLGSGRRAAELITEKLTD